MQEHPHLQKFGERLTEPKLWHLNRKSVAGGLALGLFIGFMPVVGQMFISAALAILFRVNLPIAFMAVWISNPLTIAPIFFFAYKVGAWILQVPVSEFEFAISWQWFCHEFVMIWQPFLLGCLVCGFVAALLGSLFVRIGWRLVVIRSWLQRRKNKQR
jgi:hypothetical protein